MANELFTGQTSGQTVFAVLIDGGNYYRADTDAWEAFTSADWPHYRVGLTESPGTGLYFGDLPFVPSGGQRIAFYAQTDSANTSPSGDSFLGADSSAVAGTSAAPTAVQIRTEIDANSTRLASLASGQSSLASSISALPLAVWNVLKTVAFAASSLGGQIAAFLAALGSDSRPLVTADPHTAGVTVAGISGGITLDPADPSLLHIASLLGENSGIRNAYVSGGRVISYDLVLYSSASAAQANDGATGLSAKYAVTYTYDAGGNQVAVTSVKVL